MLVEIKVSGKQGSGKTRLLDGLAEWLKDNGFRVCVYLASGEHSLEAKRDDDK